MKEASHLLKLRGRHQYSDQRSNQNRALIKIRAHCVASTSVGAVGEEDQMSRSSADGIREQLMEERREVGRPLMKREKSTGPRTDPCRTPRRTQKE